MTLQPPAGWIPGGCGVLWKHGSRAVLVRGSHIVVLRLVSLEWSRQILFHGDTLHSRSARLAYLKHNPVCSVEDGYADEQVLRGYSNRLQGRTPCCIAGLAVMNKSV
jgi:hypothetical protein